MGDWRDDLQNQVKGQEQKDEEKRAAAAKEEEAAAKLARSEVGRAMEVIRKAFDEAVVIVAKAGRQPPSVSFTGNGRSLGLSLGARGIKVLCSEDGCTLSIALDGTETTLVYNRLKGRLVSNTNQHAPIDVDAFIGTKIKALIG